MIRHRFPQALLLMFAALLSFDTFSKSTDVSDVTEFTPAKFDEVKNKALPIYSVEYSEERNPFIDAKAALTLAQRTDRRVIIEVGGDWCSWCKKMDEFLVKQPNVYQALHQHFVVLKVNVSEMNDNADFMKSLPPVLGYPHMYVAKSDGTIMLSKDTAELFDTDRHKYSSTQWLSFINQWKG